MSSVGDLLSTEDPDDGNSTSVVSDDSSRQDSLHSTPGSQQESKSSRGNRIENPRKLAAAFAIAVTVRDHSATSWVARNGEMSIFRILQRILPQVQ